MISKFKQKIKNKELTIGSWITLGDPAIAEIMAKVGFDWLVIDMEHSGLSFAQAQEIIRVIDLCKVTPLVRVMENNANMIKRYLDAGAHGVVIPMVKSKEDAQKAVNAVKYPPLGTRGVGLARAQNYSLDLDTYLKWNQENSIVIVQVEHIKAVENLEEIMSVKGVDGFIVGLYDLSGSLDCPGDFGHPKVKEALDLIWEKSKKFGYLMGEHIVRPEPGLVLDKIKQGVKFIGFSDDFLFLGEHCKSCFNEVKKNL